MHMTEAVPLTLFQQPHPALRAHYVIVFAVLIGLGVAPRAASASNLRICNRGSIPVKGVVLTEFRSRFGNSWGIDGWLALTPGQCVVAWEGSVADGYILGHLAFAVETPDGKMGAVKYNTDEGQPKPRMDQSVMSRVRSDICAPVTRFSDSGGRGQESSREIGAYKGDCMAPLQSLPVSGVAYLTGPQVFFTINVNPSADDFNRIARVLDTVAGPTMVATGQALDRARALLEARKFNEAIAAYTEALGRGPELKAFAGRALAHYFLGHYQEALTDSESAEKKYNFNQKVAVAIALEARGHTYAALGRVEEAMEAYWSAYIQDADVIDVYTPALQKCGLDIDRLKTEKLSILVREALQQKCLLAPLVRLRVP